jgi:hypothetical protein
MSDLEALCQWRAELAKRLPGLSQPQVGVLAEWSLGMVVSRSCTLSAVSLWWATLSGQAIWTVRQRLREWCYPVERKRGTKRQAVVVEACFEPLLHWIVGSWSGQQLALALDATTLGERFVVLAISVVYRGCAIPVAWAVVSAGQKGAWRPEWERLLERLRGAVPSEWTVIVLADRGLYARWLFRAIVAQGWHPFLRVNLGGTFCPRGQARFRPFRTFVPGVDLRWSGTGTAFKSADSRLSCTLLAWHGPGYADPWLILTDLPPEAADIAWYGLRAWIEQGFKITKRAGWHWQRTRMTHPDRAARLWLAVAVATLWLVSVGGEADDALSDTSCPDLSPLLFPTSRRRHATRLRLIGVFRLGWTRILAALLRHAPLPLASFSPEPWPTLPPPPPSPPASSLALQVRAA